jgi:hypothetical protein
MCHAKGTSHEINYLDFGLEIAHRCHVTRYKPGTDRVARAISLAGLVLIVLTFAIQPCLAASGQWSTGCCGHHKSCHQPAPEQICAMQATTFASPEQVEPGVSLAVVSRLSPERTISAAIASNMVTGSLPANTDSLYLRNSILLI